VDIDKGAARLSSAQTLVLLILAHYQGAESDCFPSIDTIARKAGIGSDKTVRRALADLVCGGLLHIAHGGQHRPNRYTLQRAALEALPRFQPGHGDRSVRSVQPGNRDRSGDVQSGHGDRSGDPTPEKSRPVMVSPRPVMVSLQTGHGDPRSSQGSSQRSPQTERRSLPLPRVDLGAENGARSAPEAAKPSSDPAKVMAAFVAVYADTHGGERPIIDGPKDGKATKKLLSSLKTADAAIAVIRRAFETDFVRTNKLSLAYIAANVNAYRGSATKLPPRVAMIEASSPVDGEIASGEELTRLVGESLTITSDTKKRVAKITGPSPTSKGALP
jgi:hypothetical protein